MSGTAAMPTSIRSATTLCIHLGSLIYPLTYQGQERLARLALQNQPLFYGLLFRAFLKHSWRSPLIRGVLAPILVSSPCFIRGARTCFSIPMSTVWSQPEGSRWMSLDGSIAAPTSSCPCES